MQEVEAFTNFNDFQCCAVQDKKDDVIAGVKSTALLFADNTKPWLSAFAASQIALLAVTGGITISIFIALQLRWTLISFEQMSWGWCLHVCCLAGHMTDAGVPYYASLAAASGHLAWQISSVQLNSREDCMAKFVSNKWFGAILFSGIVADKLLQ